MICDFELATWRWRRNTACTYVCTYVFGFVRTYALIFVATYCTVLTHYWISLNLENPVLYIFIFLFLLNITCEWYLQMPIFSHKYYIYFKYSYSLLLFFPLDLFLALLLVVALAPLFFVPPALLFLFAFLPPFVSAVSFSSSSLF